MLKYIRAWAEDEGFQSFILGLIILNAIAMGLETSVEFCALYGDYLSWLFWGSQIIFAFEILIRLIAFFPRLRHFFGDFWNTFDFVIVAFSFLPMVGNFVLVARLLRILRVLRAVSVSDKLRSFLSGMHMSLSIVLHASCVAAVLLYVFAISGFYLFSEIDPAHWGSLGRAVLSVFYGLLLQDVPKLVEPVAASSGLNLLFFAIQYICWFTLLTHVLTITNSLANRDNGAKGADHD